MDERTRQAIIDTVQEALSHAMSEYEERWLTAKQTCEQFQMFNMSWLKENGEMLGRKRVRTIDPDGTEHCSSWAYPRNHIQRMILEGRLDFLRKDKCQYRPSKKDNRQRTIDNRIKSNK